MNRTKLTLISTALALPLVATNLAGAAPTNFVKNGDFSQGLAHWGDYDAWKTTFTITPGGAASFQAKNPSASGSTYIGASQCLQIPSDQQPYQVAADLFIPANQARKGFARIRVASYANTVCQGWLAEEEKYATGSQQVTFPALVPPGTKSFRISIGVESYDATAGEDPSVAFRAEFDNVAIVGEAAAPEPPVDPVKPDEPDPVEPILPDPPQLPEPPKPELPNPVAPFVPQGPFDIFIPGPLGQGPKSEPSAQPSGPSNPEPEQPQQPANPGHPEQPKANEPASQPETPAAVAAATPLPPSTGSGLMSDSRSTVPLFGAAFLALSSAFAAAGALMRRR